MKRMCSTRPNPGAATRLITNPNPGGGNYALDSQGCVLAAEADVPWLVTQGFAPGDGSPLGKGLTFTTGVAAGTTDFIVGILPAGAYIEQIVIKNLTANAVTGNVSIGTTANGTDVVASQAVGANALLVVSDAATLKRVFSDTIGTPLHMAAVTAWNAANVTVSIVFGYY
jgi:hypothetical protein